MPELPEVEVVKRSLEKYIKNLTIKSIRIKAKKLRYIIDRKKLKKTAGKKINSIKRRSKYLLLNLNNNQTILVHLGMTGKFFIIDKKKETKKTSFYYKLSFKDKKHNHLIFYLNKNIRLIYNDVRKFGFIKVILSENLKSNSHLKTLGPEPLSNKFNISYIKKYIINKKKSLKDLLMDQKFVSGLGNIYVNEILFLSGLNPYQNIQNTRIVEFKKIIKSTRKILKKSIKEGGSSIKNFNDSKGKNGSYQQLFNVYGREGVKCVKNKCRVIITKTNMSNRATFFCKSCQK
ncbi:MAG: bifunctional DNA-formamidopyrimidine glycosylase/DNA-(apurinic or apyrimidinic site) lyase [Pelagibacteraceae bacterium]